MPGNTYDVVVIGRGIIGGTIAWRLRQAGLSVASIDSVQRGAATKAAAGMLAAMAESNSLPELAKLSVPSLRMYPDFLAELESDSGIAVPLNGPGILRIALDEEEDAHLHETYESHADVVQFLTGDEARSLEPGLAGRVISAVLSPTEKHVTPSVLMDAVTTAFKRTGIVEFTDSVVRLRRTEDAWTVDMTSQTIAGKQVVIAAGAWAPALLAPLRFDAPITPLKGELLLMRYRRTPPPAHTIFAHGTYIVPRPGGDVVLGATEDPTAGFDASTTIVAVNDLRARGAGILPTIADAQMHKGLVGVRPATPDRLPMIGRVPGVDDIFIAGGHGRNGVLLTPITAKMIRDLIVDGAQPPASVEPGRFSNPQ